MSNTTQWNTQVPASHKLLFHCSAWVHTFFYSIPNGKQVYTRIHPLSQTLEYFGTLILVVIIPVQPSEIETNTNKNIQKMRKSSRAHNWQMACLSQHVITCALQRMPRKEGIHLRCGRCHNSYRMGLSKTVVFLSFVILCCWIQWNI